MESLKTMDEDCQETLGQYLRRERESRRISLEELSGKMRIGSSFLKALEEDNFGFFSQHQFIPGFLRRYSVHLGLDQEEVIRRFTAQCESPLPEKPPPKSLFPFPLYKAWKRRLPSPTRPRRWIPMAAALAAAGLLAAIYFLPDISKRFQGTKPVLPVPQASAPQAPISPSSAPAEGKSIPGEGLKSPENSPAQAYVGDKEANLGGEPPDKPSAPAAGPMKVIGNRDSKRYHLPGMEYYDKVKAYHRVEFDSEEEAIQAGYRKAAR